MEAGVGMAGVNTANYVATQLLHDLRDISPQTIDAAPQLMRRLVDMQRDLGLGKVRLFVRDGKIAFSLVPYE